MKPLNVEKEVLSSSDYTVVYEDHTEFKPTRTEGYTRQTYLQVDDPDQDDSIAGPTEVVVAPTTEFILDMPTNTKAGQTVTYNITTDYSGTVNWQVPIGNDIVTIVTSDNSSIELSITGTGVIELRAWTGDGDESVIQFNSMVQVTQPVIEVLNKGEYTMNQSYQVWVTYSNNSAGKEIADITKYSYTDDSVTDFEDICI